MAHPHLLAQRWCQFMTEGGYIEFTVRLQHPILYALAQRAQKTSTPGLMQSWMEGIAPAEIHPRTLRGLVNGVFTLRVRRAGDNTLLMTLVERRIHYYITPERFAALVPQLLHPAHPHVSVEVQLSNGTVLQSGASRGDALVFPSPSFSCSAGGGCGASV